VGVGGGGATLKFHDKLPEKIKARRAIRMKIPET